MPVKIERIIASDFFPYYRGQSPAEYERALEAHVERLHRRGVTHVMVNAAMVNIPLAMVPDNPYFGFGAYGPGPDKYVTSSYNRGIYAEELLALNREMLLHNVNLAKKYGFRGAMRCVEPVFMMESFFKRWPQLRGPRVDNPACSTDPVYALCPMLEETQDHYQQLIRNLLTLAPEIDEMHIFTNDSGGGVCHSSHLYSGPNGPQLCRHASPGEQARVFCQTLVEGGRTVNPGFRVVMTSGLSPKEKRDFAQEFPAGVASSVYGAFAWGGGMEDRWGTQAAGPKVYGNPDERAKVRGWQYADHEARIRQIQEHGGIVYANYNSDYYSGDDPRPYETHEIICQLLDWGVTNIIGGAPGSYQYSANTAVFRHALAHGRVPTPQAVAEIAREWVGEALASTLCQVWQLNDVVAREQPLPNAGHLLQIWAYIRHMPIVPDETQLAAGDLDYFSGALQSYDTKMKEQQGGVWRILHNGQALKEAYLRQFQAVVFPKLEEALGLLDGLLAGELTDAQRQCLTEQRTAIAGVLVEHRHNYHWLAASLHRIAGETAPEWVPSLREIIQAEIDLYAAKMPDSPRLALMRAHIDDPAVRVDLSAFPLSVHAEMASWEGAHEIEG
jgi:hypothetical protein